MGAFLGGDTRGTWEEYASRLRVQASRRRGRRRDFIGYFDDEEQAARAKDAAILPLAGEFARLNFPPTSSPVALAP